MYQGNAMPLSIESLRLTGEEQAKARRRAYNRYDFYPSEVDIAKAQLAKACYEFLDWLDGDLPNQHYVIHKLAGQLEKALEQANIERPTARKAG